MTRKEFLRLGILAFTALALGGLGRHVLRLLRLEPPAPEETEPPEPTPDRDRPPPRPAPEHPPGGGEEHGETGWERRLGLTGERVGLLGLGGAGLISRAGRTEEAVRLIERALDLGVNFLDTAPTYADGVSERHIGQVMRHRREEAFLASKTLDRSYDGTMRLIEGSLGRLETDYLDLYQLHGIRDRADAEAALRPDGALRALQKLRDAGTVRFIGVTGHRDPAPLRFLLEEEEFHCVLMPLNPAEVHFRSFRDGLLDFAVERDLGIVAMKVAAYGRLFRPDGVSSMRQSLRYVGSLPVSTAVVGHDSPGQLEENASVCRDFAPCEPEEMRRLEGLAEPYQEEANFYKTAW